RVPAIEEFQGFHSRLGGGRTDIVARYLRACRSADYRHCHARIEWQTARRKASLRETFATNHLHERLSSRRDRGRNARWHFLPQTVSSAGTAESRLRRPALRITAPARPRRACRRAGTSHSFRAPAPPATRDAHQQTPSIPVCRSESVPLSSL